MPDWLTTIVVAVLSGLFGAGGFAAYVKVRTDARLSAEAQQDKHTLDLINALDASEAEFRNAVLAAYQSEVSARRDLDSRLTTTQQQLTAVTLERDELKRKLERTQVALERAQSGLEHAQADLDQAHQKIRRMEDEIATLQHQQHTASAE